MAGTCTSITRHVIGSSTVELSGIATLSFASFSARISMKINGASATCGERQLPQLSAECPSCIYVGPIETARKETLEALYRQVKCFSFTFGSLKLWWYGSKSVVKYPRCSIGRQSTYADAEVDISQVFALASIWIIFLAFGCSALIWPIIYTVVLAYQDAFGSGISHGSQASMITVSCHSEWYSLHGSGIFDWLSSCISFCEGAPGSMEE